jgi:hypothetical protein
MSSMSGDALVCRGWVPLSFKSQTDPSWQLGLLQPPVLSHSLPCYPVLFLLCHLWHFYPCFPPDVSPTRWKLGLHVTASKPWTTSCLLPVFMSTKNAPYIFRSWQTIKILWYKQLCEIQISVSSCNILLDTNMSTVCGCFCATMCHGGCDRDCNREEAISEKSKIFSTVLDACNLSYLGGRKQEDHCSKPARANSSVRPYLK